jgi:hypothetical protein
LSFGSGSISPSRLAISTPRSSTNITVNFGASLLARKQRDLPSVEPCWARTLQSNSFSKAGSTFLRMNSPWLPPQMPIWICLPCAQPFFT